MKLKLAVVGFLLLLCCPAWAQSVKLPVGIVGQPGDFVVVTAETDDAVVRWYSVDAGLKLFPVELLKDTRSAVVVSLLPGRYRLLAISAKDGTPSEIAECTITIGSPPPTPPPGPGPGPGPPPPPDPVPVVGPRELVILRESAHDTPSQARLFTALRAGVAADYLKSKGHELVILDVDAENADGQPAKIIQEWQGIITGLPLPVLVVVDRASRKILAKTSLPANTNADDVLAVLKQHGG